MMQRVVSSVVLVVLALAASRASADVVEFLSGSQLEGKVVARDAQSITIEVTLGGRALSRKCPIDRVHAVTIGTQREVLHEKPGGANAPRGAAEANAPAGAAAPAQRTPAEIEALIDRLGRTPPTGGTPCPWITRRRSTSRGRTCRARRGTTSATWANTCGRHQSESRQVAQRRAPDAPPSDRPQGQPRDAPEGDGRAGAHVLHPVAGLRARGVLVA